jgi:agmatine/peptidylarginine deiminase
MIPDQDTNTIFFSDLLRTNPKYAGACNRITSVLDSFGVQYNFLPKTKDIWARDYMPIQISEDKFIEYRYDPDYLQGDQKKYRDLKTYPDIVCDTIGQKTIKSEILIDGGNVVKAKNCIILTDKIVYENRYLCNKTKLIKRLKDTFEVEKVILLPWYKREEYGHADGVLRFVDDSTVLVHQIWKTEDKLIRELEINGLQIEWLEFSVSKTDKRNWAYINFLQTKDLILVPKLNIEEDQQAFEQICRHYASYAAKGRIVQVEIPEVVKKGGALNCCTWTKQK